MNMGIRITHTTERNIVETEKIDKNGDRKPRRLTKMEIECA